VPGDGIGYSQDCLVISIGNGSCECRAALPGVKSSWYAIRPVCIHILRTAGDPEACRDQIVRHSSSPTARAETRT
jgi:hypothetical protein